MKWYADSPGHQSIQIVADVFLLCFLAVSAWLGKEVNDGISTLRGPADGLTSAGDSFRGQHVGGGRDRGRHPVAGWRNSSTFEAVWRDGGERTGLCRDVGRVDGGHGGADGGDRRGRLPDRDGAVGVGVLPDPVRAARDGGVPVGWRSERSMELFALRALTRQPLRRLAPLGPDLAGRFRDGDPVLVHQLAALELTSCGVSVDGGGRVPRWPDPGLFRSNPTQCRVRRFRSPKLGTRSGEGGKPAGQSGCWACPPLRRSGQISHNCSDMSGGCSGWGRFRATTSRSVVVADWLSGPRRPTSM